MKNKLLLTIFALSLTTFSITPRAHAACPASLTTNGFDNGQTSSLTSTTCAIPTNTLYVVDNGTTENSTTNTAAFTITNSTLTIQSGSILNTGSLSLGTGASVVLQGGSIALGPRWVGGETDADGYTDSLTTLYTATAAGRRRISLMKSKTTTDCNGAAAGYNYTLPSTYYVDADQDTFTVSSQAGVTGICSNQSTWDTATSTTVPGGAIGTAVSFNAGTRRTAASGTTDCNDANSALITTQSCYIDSDSDTYANGSGSVCAGASCTNVAGYRNTSSGTDCNDGNASIYINRTGYTDSDSDGYGTTTPGTVCSGASLPAGYVANNTDCNDTTNTIRTRNITGGTITTSGSDSIHTFTTSGTLTVTCPASLNVQALIVGGGGNGGRGEITQSDTGGGGGGGGGGGLIYNASMAVTSGAKTITVGGAGANSSFNGSTAIAGGAGSIGTFGYGGSTGGSGGGGGRGGGGGAGTAGQGYAGAGGLNNGSSPYGGGGGSAGGAASGNSAGTGYTSSISGSSLIYGVGGTGGWYGTNAAGAAATANRGNGGGGGSAAFVSYGQGGAGGSGIVIVRYANP